MKIRVAKPAAMDETGGKGEREAGQRGAAKLVARGIPISL